MYDGTRSHEDYEISWETEVNQKELYVESKSIYIGPQEVAAEVTLRQTATMVLSPELCTL